MSPDRRHLLLGLAAALGACHHPILGPAHFDPKLLDKDAAALVARARPAAFAIGIMELKTQKVWYAGGESPFPLGGLAALPIAATVLSLVDEHKLALTEKLTVRRADLAPPPSLIDQSWRAKPDSFAMNITTQDLLTLALQYGDQTASDALLLRVGGPGVVTAWLHDKGLTGLRVDRYAREIGVQMSGLGPFRPEWRAAPLFQQALRDVPVTARQKAMEAYVAEPKDTTSAQALLALLYRVSTNDLLSKASADLMFRLMAPALGAVGPLGVAWPAGAGWAHKSADPRSDLGYTPIQGDAGLLTLKDGRRFGITALMAGSTASETQRAQLFADTARLLLKAMGG